MKGNLWEETKLEQSKKHGIDGVETANLITNEIKIELEKNECENIWKKKLTGIYLLKSPSNKFYVGQSVDIYKRFNSYKYGKCKSQRKLYNAIKKYGLDNFEKIVLEECLISELNENEKFWIIFFNSLDGGYNLDSGGGNGRMVSDETKSILFKLKIENNDDWGIYYDKRRKTYTFRFKHNGNRVSKCGIKSLDECRIYKQSVINNFDFHIKKSNYDTLEKIRLKKRENLLWGIKQYKIGYRVAFKENKKLYTKRGFPTIESVILYRNGLVNNKYI